MKIYVAGHKGMVGSAIMRQLKIDPENNVIYRKHTELDLMNQSEVQEFIRHEKPDQIYLAAAKVGGIYANNAYPADFIYENLMIETNIINAAFSNGVKKLLFLGSSCIYPKFASQPMREEALLTGSLEPTNEPYAIAKIAGIKLCESFNRQHGKSHDIDYRCVMPTNLYGPGDNYHSENSHVIPALISRFHEAKVTNKSSVSVWGTGTPKREFLYVDDMASASIYVMNLSKKVYDKQMQNNLSHLNVGYGDDISIRELAEIVNKTVGFEGKIVFDHSRSDGSPQKLMDSSRLNSLGWNAKVELEVGLKMTYSDFLKNYNQYIL
jgi:GDP-L-fucose synthase